MIHRGEPRFADARILIFAKAPIPGRAKTRLIPALGAEGAARLHQELLAATVERLTLARVAPLELWCAPNTDHPLFGALGTRFGPALFAQRSGDLGQRMLDAAQQALARASAVVLVGSDCPHLDGPHATEAIDALHQSDCDAVLGPAADGGYVLLALKRAAPLLFEDMPWGGERVAELTRERMRCLGWRWRELRALRDLDRPEDLAWFQGEQGPGLDCLRAPNACR